MQEQIILIFFNSLSANLILALHSENVWFAALAFGDFTMFPATIAAFIGSVIAMGVNFGLGYYTSGMRERFAHYNEEWYENISSVVNRYIIFVFLVPSVPFLSLFAVCAGLLRVNPLKFTAIIIIGRIGYYAYYLIHGIS